MSHPSRTARWEDSWANNRLGWHADDINPHLQDFLNKYFQDEKHLRIFVPLCGKSVDMYWLYKQGHFVLGVDAVEQAATDFFTEQKLAYEETWCSITGSKVYKSHDERIVFYVSDLLTLNLKAYEGSFDAVWDRGSLVAIYSQDRQQYIKAMLSLLKPDYKVLIEAVDYGEDEDFKGPPRKIDHSTLTQLYGSKTSIETLSVEDISEQPRVRQMWGVKNWCQEKIFLVQSKQ